MAGGDRLDNETLAVRDFNRFYTARFGLLSRRLLDGELSLTESRVLYEVGTQSRLNASTLREALDLDRGYISRVLAGLSNRNLVTQVVSGTDRREKVLALTHLGKRALARINEQSTAQVMEMLLPLTPSERTALVASLAEVKQMLGPSQSSRIRVEQLKAVTDQAINILEEYYDAVHVVVRDEVASLQKLIGSPASGIWLAHHEGAVMGCVVLRKLVSIPHASECKRLYVKPTARGRGIANKLLDAQEEYARAEGVQWIYLDSYDDLKTAIALYERRGYVRCERYNDNPQATLYMRKRL